MECLGRGLALSLRVYWLMNAREEGSISPRVGLALGFKEVKRVCELDETTPLPELAEYLVQTFHRRSWEARRPHHLPPA